MAWTDESSTVRFFFLDEGGSISSRLVSAELTDKSSTVRFFLDEGGSILSRLALAELRFLLFFVLDFRFFVGFSPISIPTLFSVSSVESVESAESRHDGRSTSIGDTTGCSTGRQELAARACCSSTTVFGQPSRRTLIETYSSTFEDIWQTTLSLASNLLDLPWTTSAVYHMCKYFASPTQQILTL